jgi:PKD repeat protein
MKRLLTTIGILLSGVAANAQCTAALSATAAPSGNDLLRVSITNSSSYGTPGGSYMPRGVLNFNDGTATVQTWGSSGATHTFASPGTYHIGLRISKIDSFTNAVLCTDTTTVSVTVAYPACGSVIAITGSGASRSFSASNPAGTSGMTYNWSFGDGTTGTGSSLSHTYAASGTYTVTCTSGNGSCTYVNTRTIGVYVPPAPLVCASLSANFSSTVSGSAVTFNNTSTFAGASYNHDAHWDFGDGGTATMPYLGTTSHTYTATGVYTVKMAMAWHDTFSTSVCHDTIIKTVTITSLSPASIRGSVIFNQATYGTPALKVWLIQYNSATNMLTAVDSQSAVYNTWGGADYQFNGKPAGAYLVKASLQTNPSSGTGLIPTYSDSSLTWNTARTVNATAAGITYATVMMRTGTQSSGPGFIGGNVSLGANKGSAAGVSGLTMLLYTTSGQPVQAAMTDANGNFSFSNVAAGTYNVYPEAMNYAASAASVTISAGNTQAKGIDFKQDDTRKSIKPSSSTLGISGASSSAAAWSLFPNPASDRLTLSWQTTVSEAAGIAIMDIAGKKVLQAQIQPSAAGRQTIDISSLRPGMYFVQGTGAFQGEAHKLTIR